MSIQFACPECGNRLQVKDELARQRVACPDCRALLRAPAPESAPPVEAVPVAEVVAASKRTAPRSEDMPVLEEAEPPPRKVWDLHSGEPGSHSNVVVRRLDQLSGAAVRWSGFASGCWLVKLALWVELAGIAVLVLGVELSLIGVSSKTRWLVAADWAGPFFALPFLILLFVGSVMGAVGRFRMLMVPVESSAGGVLRGALVLAGLKVTAAVGALAFGLLSGVQWVNQQPAEMLRYGMYATIAQGLAMSAGKILEASSVPALAVIGGEIPNAPLRSSASLVALVYQIVATIWLGLSLFVTYFVGVQRGLDALIRPDAPGAEPKLINALDTLLLAAGTVFAIVLALETAYTWLNASLYGAALTAAAGANDLADESPE